MYAYTLVCLNSFSQENFKTHFLVCVPNSFYMLNSIPLCDLLTKSPFDEHKSHFKVLAIMKKVVDYFFYQKKPSVFVDKCLLLLLDV